ncbi:hypothetical protein [Cellulomonas xiejunii]|uniref:hypothetical protein n=1 Tax=Cellulomonas xiejunii TaxID=2968083 RepID=UPI001D0DE20A|nr:hypothetical protein [Cellulomonas xiejunii]MCC2314075.1 hypothetical protein [Cellulomonas xiejunii]
MATVGTRDLKQEPLAVVCSALETGEAVEVTTHGHPTGVALVPAVARPQRWVRGEDMARITPMSADATRRRREDLADVEQAPHIGVGGLCRVAPEGTAVTGAR